MDDRKAVIIIAGAGAALWLYKRNQYVTLPNGTKVLKTSAAGKAAIKAPVRGTNSPYVASTNMATGNGTRTIPRVPSSGLGYGTTNRGVAQAPTGITGVVAGGENVLAGLLGFLARKPVTANSPKSSGAPSSSGQKPSSGSSGSGGSSGGGSGAAGPRGAGLGGAAGVAGQAYSNGYFDDNGQWIGYSGYYGADGQFIQMNADGTLPGNDQGGNGLTAITPDLSSGSSSGIDFTQFSSAAPQDNGAVDENGNFDPTAEPAVETLYSDDPTVPLAATQTVPFDSSEGINSDPIVFDQPGIDGNNAGDLATIDAGADFSGGGDEAVGSGGWDDGGAMEDF